MHKKDAQGHRVLGGGSYKLTNAQKHIPLDLYRTSGFTSLGLKRGQVMIDRLIVSYATYLAIFPFLFYADFSGVSRGLIRDASGESGALLFFFPWQPLKFSFSTLQKQRSCSQNLREVGSRMLA